MKHDEAERRKMVREVNDLRNEVRILEKKLRRLEEHEGDDGTKEDIDAQCALVDNIAEKNRRIASLRKALYP